MKLYTLALNHQIQNNQSILNQSWPSTLTNQNSVDYSSHLLSATLPISLQHFLKYSETMKKDHVSSSNSVNNILNSSLNSSNLGNLSNSFDNSSLNLKNDLLGLKNGSANNLNLSNLSHLNNQWTNSDSHVSICAYSISRQIVLLRKSFFHIRISAVVSSNMEIIL